MPKTVHLKSPIAGVVEQVDADEATELLAQGWTVPSDADIREFDLDQKYGGFGYGLAAAGTGAASTATFGASDLAIEALGLDKEVADIQETHDIPTTIGEVGGALLGLGKFSAAGKGAGLLARGGKGALRAAAAPGRALMAVGEAVEGTGAATKGALGILRAGGRGALEGAAYGGRELVHEATIHDQEVTPELLASTVGMGALLGGGMGSALSAGGKAAGWGRERLQAAMASEEGVEGVAQSLFGYAAKGLGKTMAGINKALGRPGSETIEEFVTNPAVRQRGVHGAENIAARVDDFHNVHTELEEKLAFGQNKLKGKAKLSEIEYRVEPERVRAQVEESRRLIGETRKAFDEIMDKAEDFSRKKMRGEDGLEMPLLHAEEALKNIEKKVALDPHYLNPERLAGTTGSKKTQREIAKLFEAVDQLKREEGIITQWYAERPRLSGRGHATKGKLSTLYSELQSGLENRAIWGDELAGFQEIVNDHWTPLIQADKFNKYGQIWLEKRAMPGHFEGNAYLPSRERTAGIFSQVTNPTGDKAIIAMRERLENGANFNRMAAKRVKNLSAEEREYLLSTADDADKLRGMLDEVAEDATRVNQLRILSQGSDAAGLMGGLVGYGVGTGNPALAAAGALATPLLNPARTIRQLAAVDDLVAGAKSKLAGAAGPLKKAAKAAKPAVIRSTLTARDRHRSERAAIAAKEASATDIRSRVQSSLASLSGGAPMTVEAASDVVARAVGYLAEHAPKPRRTLGALGAVEMPPSDEAIERFERRRRMVNKPELILADLDGGVVSYEAVDALSKVYPFYFQQLKDGLANEIAVLGTKGLVIPYPHARNVAIILGTPVDPVDTPEVAKMISDTYHEPEPEQKPPRERPDTAPDLADKLESDDDLENVT